ncbi:hypothetical protein LTR37_017880 [Vermiconidia calcicola]|uniref:Uncharacterized protein n=2 Tax=Vermiconidia calcicola TaxID=1690605 RepID=A0ACC3MD99_9PEZI|nr:hypothetical protein LTR37_019795 [Vermiconidia calcicola]KAK3696627.1 hypothetical protein LTR37_017880 [Vermiconidia calcicola]
MATAPIRRPPFFDPTHQRGLASLLSQTYGKPVTLNLIKLHRPQDDADILAQHIAQKLKDRKAAPRRVLRDAAWKANLPTQTSITKQQQELLQRRATTKPLSLATLNHGSGPTNVGDVLKDLKLPQVSSVAAEAAGRLSARITANRAQGKVARRGLTGKGEEGYVRGVVKANTTKGMRAGKRRIGSYGVRVSLGHS